MTILWFTKITWAMDTLAAHGVIGSSYFLCCLRCHFRCSSRERRHFRCSSSHHFIFSSQRKVFVAVHHVISVAAYIRCHFRCKSLRALSVAVHHVKFPLQLTQHFRCSSSCFISVSHIISVSVHHVKFPTLPYIACVLFSLYSSILFDSISGSDNSFSHRMLGFILTTLASSPSSATCSVSLGPSFFDFSLPLLPFFIRLLFPDLSLSTWSVPVVVDLLLVSVEELFAMMTSVECSFNWCDSESFPWMSSNIASVFEVQILSWVELALENTVSFGIRELRLEPSTNRSSVCPAVCCNAICRSIKQFQVLFFTNM